MIRFSPLILKSLWRHRSRTSLTVSGAAVALFLVCFLGAIQDGMRDLRTRQQAQRTLVTFQANKFCPATSHLPQDYADRIARLPGVSQVVPIQVFTNNCRASLDVIVFHGMSAEQLRLFRNLQLSQGSWNEFEDNQDAALVGRAVARRRGIRLHDRFSIAGVTVTVAGIFSGDSPSEDNYIYTHLEFLQRRQGENQVGTVTQFEVRLAENVDPEMKCKEIDGLLRNGPVATQTRPKGVFQTKSLGDLVGLIELGRYLGLACLGLVFTLVATTTLMSVQDRAQEHAVLKTLGFSGSRVFRLVLAESVLLSTVGGVLGVGSASVVLAHSGLAIGAEAITVAFQPSLRLAGTGLGVALVTGVLAGLAPAWSAARIEIAPALRS
jgi:putative ABC transport system permease protein